MVKSLIFGAPGQDSYFLSELLVERGDKVTACHRHTYLSGEFKDFPAPMTFQYCDMMDAKSIESVIKDTVPDEIYNLAANSFIGDSFKSPAQVLSNNIISHTNLLEAVRLFSPDSKIYYAGSSEELDITSPYGVSKNAVCHLNDIYRNAYAMFIVHAWNFNHTSWRHSQKFLVGKVCKYVADLNRWMNKYEIMCTNGPNIQGKSKTSDNQFSWIPKLELGYLGSYKDISYAEDVMRAAIVLMGSNTSGTSMVGSGQVINMYGVVDYAFNYCNVDFNDFIIQNSNLNRPAETITHYASCDKLKELGWEPSIGVKQLIKSIIDEYIERGI